MVLFFLADFFVVKMFRSRSGIYCNPRLSNFVGAECRNFADSDAGVGSLFSKPKLASLLNVSLLEFY